MNVWPIGLRFSCGSVTPSERVEEPVATRRRRAGRPCECAPKACGDRVALAGAEQAVVDEDAGDLRAERLRQQRGGDRRIDAAGQPADDPVVGPDPPADLGRPSRSMNASIVHVPRAAADPVEEVAQDQRRRRACAPTSGWNWSP